MAGSIPDYQVRLDAFCGPLDLLLYLIRRAEVGINDISITEITDQYLEFLRQVEDIDIEAAGEFLVMAATLMEIKSRTLMPPGAAGEEGAADGAPGWFIEPSVDSDPRIELVQQLLEYQRYRVASEDLHARRESFLRQHFAQPDRSAQAIDVAEERELELEDAHVLDLFEAYERVTSAIDFNRMGAHRVEIDDTPAAVYQGELMERIAACGGRIALQAAFEGRRPVQRLGLFLAALELVRLRRITVAQEDLLSEIVLETVTDDPAPRA